MRRETQIVNFRNSSEESLRYCIHHLASDLFYNRTTGLLTEQTASQLTKRFLKTVVNHDAFPFRRSLEGLENDVVEVQTKSRIA